MSFRLGIDIGGTFTDFALIDHQSGRALIWKQLTTPRDPSVSVIEGTQALLDAHGVRIEQVTEVVHGTTLVTNAVIERKGATIGMLVTAGFGDALDIGLERRYDLYDLRLEFPPALVARRLRVEIDERVRYDGSVVKALDPEVVRRALARLIGEHQIEAVAVCLLHSYANPRHEQQIREIIREAYPSLFVSISSEIFPFMREYDRWTTTTVNAYAQPMVDRYLARLEQGLREIGFTGKLIVMASNGGTITPSVARRFPVRMLESGPAAGVLMSSFHGRALQLPNLLSFDMGGTTAKGSLIREYAPLKRYDLEVARMHEYKKGSGLPVKIPVIDMIEIGAGGGSIAEVDERGVIRVGPRSAGADPGPACYGRGGDKPTLTDANLMLGYLAADFFLGGAMALDREASKRAIFNGVASRLDLDAMRAAWGIHEIINEDVARAFRIHASERGIDYRGCSMVAFGGSGPLHAMRIASKLKIPRVVFPVGAGVMSAFGLLASPYSFEIARSDRVFLDDLTTESFTARFAALIDQSTAVLRDAQVSEDSIKIMRRLDMRYRGQGYEIEVVLPADADARVLAKIPQLFSDAYAAVFSMSFPGERLEIVNWKVEAVGPPPQMGAHRLEQTTATASPRKGTRTAYFPEADGLVECAVYDRYALRPGMQIDGPALIEENESTCVIGVADRVSVDQRFNLIADIAARESIVT